jgi:hypothetical protein
MPVIQSGERITVYDAFVSYSHSKDKPIAAALQNAMQRLGKPWYRRRAVRIFRDDTSLSATPHLWPAIEQALGKSRYFILLASSEAAASKWVNMEVTYWLEHNSPDTLLIGLTEGELAWDDQRADFQASEKGPLPPVLAGRFRTEPKWVDLRLYRDTADKRDAKFTELAADFAAAVRRIPKEDLLSQEVRQQRRALALAWSAAGALAVLAALAGYQWFEAVAQKKRAEIALLRAARTANELMGGLATGLRNRVGMPVDLVGEIVVQAQQLRKALASSDDNPRLRLDEARSLYEVAVTLLDKGDTTVALETAQRSVAIMEGLRSIPIEQRVQQAWSYADGKPDDLSDNRIDDELVKSYGTLGDALVAMEQLEDAVGACRHGLALAEERAAKLHKDRVGIFRLPPLVRAYHKLGDGLMAAGYADHRLPRTRRG